MSHKYYKLTYSFADFTGFVTRVWSGKSKIGNEYLDVKLNIEVYQYQNIRIMKSQNPTIKEDYVKTLQAGSMPIKMKKVYVTSNGTVFFNTFRGNRIEEEVSVGFKSTEHTKLSIQQIKDKGNGTFTVYGCIKWFGETEIHETKPGEIKQLRECVIYDGVSHMIMTIREDLLKQNLKEMSLKNYFGLKLSNTTLTKAEEFS